LASEGGGITRIGSREVARELQRRIQIHLADGSWLLIALGTEPLRLTASRTIRPGRSYQAGRDIADMKLENRRLRTALWLFFMSGMNDGMLKPAFPEIPTCL
jgi:hypothetical protein